MDSDPSDKDTDAGKQATRSEQRSWPDATATSQTDRSDESAADGNQPVESQPAASGASVELGVVERESITGDALLLDAPSLLPPVSSDPATPTDSPAAPSCVGLDGVYSFESMDSHSTGAVTPQLAESLELALPPAQPVTPEDFERSAQMPGVDPSSFQDTDGPSMDPVDELTMNRAEDSCVAPTIESPSPIEDTISLSRYENAFSDSLEVVGAPPIAPIDDAPPTVRSHWSAEPDDPISGTSSTSDTQELWAPPEPTVSPPPSGSSGERGDFRMPPLLLEVSFAETQNFRDDFLDYFVPIARKLVRECVEAEFDQRDFIRAAELRALYGR